MRKRRSIVLVEKSIEACLAAMEIYNKPDFRYREEAFSILMLNAWELLLKARVLKENNNNIRSIEIRETRERKNGGKTVRKYPCRNRSGNVSTISIVKAAEIVRQYQDGIETECIENIHMLMEIRDNAVHLHNVTLGLAKRMQEVGAASLQNFVHAVEGWFDYDLSRYNSYIMPLAFHPPGAVVHSLLTDRHSAHIQRLLDYFSDTEGRHPSDERKNYNVTMEVEMRFVRASTGAALPVAVSTDPGALKIQLFEEDVRRRFPWDYGKLITRLLGRYVYFPQNNQFYALKRELEQDTKLSKVRYLDPGNPKSSKKKFYSPNIVVEFDKHYKLK